MAIFTAIATSRTQHLLAAHAAPTHALTAGFQRALLVGSILILASAVIALRATNTRGETDAAAAEAPPETADGSPLRAPQPALEEARRGWNGPAATES